jgi:nitrate reductase NapE component
LDAASSNDDDWSNSMNSALKKGANAVVTVVVVVIVLILLSIGACGAFSFFFWLGSASKFRFSVFADSHLVGSGRIQVSLFLALLFSLCASLGSVRV